MTVKNVFKVDHMERDKERDNERDTNLIFQAELLTSLSSHAYHQSPEYIYLG